ncbi:MAG TPA: hypothetical protein VEK08_07170 [Planctomycetota bacterium]|nr:hypothetical protein [Planctomycetota bacterium]
MTIRKTFSQRERIRLGHAQNDVFQYDSFPEAFRNQVGHILYEALGSGGHSLSATTWQRLEQRICKELGYSSLDPRKPVQQALYDFIVFHASPAQLLDIIDVAFYYLTHEIGSALFDEPNTGAIVAPEKAVEDLNYRFKQHLLGYAFENGELLRIDSKLIHAEVIKPALALLKEPGFEGPLDEFLQAFQHHRHAENKEAINSALKAFESTMKCICAQRGWPLDGKETASRLVDILFQNKLVPDYLQTGIGGVRSTLDGALNTLRNRTSGHGQGSTPADVPEHFVSYALHLAAANIVFLIRSNKAMGA